MTWLLALALLGDAVDEVRAAVAEHTRALPNYFCRQETARYFTDRAGSRKRLIDRVEAEVAYVGEGQEVRGLKVNGKPVRDSRALTAAGVWTGGEFGTLLRNIFDPALPVEFKVKGEGRTLDFVAPREASRWEVWQGSAKVVVPFQGTIRLEAASKLPQRILKRTRTLPAGMGVDLLEVEVEYGWVKLGARQVWLPVRSESLSCLARQQSCYCNATEYKGYRRFEAESRLVP
jgi:hypothetical protein